MAETASPSIGRAENFYVRVGNRSTQRQEKPREPAPVINLPAIRVLVTAAGERSVGSFLELFAANICNPRDQGRTALIIIARYGARRAEASGQGHTGKRREAETEAIYSAELEVRIQLPPAASQRRIPDRDLKNRSAGGLMSIRDGQQWAEAKIKKDCFGPGELESSRVWADQYARMDRAVAALKRRSCWIWRRPNRASVYSILVAVPAPQFLS